MGGTRSARHMHEPAAERLGVRTYLVHRGQNSRDLEDLLQMLGLEVGYANGLGEALLLDRLHVLPDRLQVGMVRRGVDEEEIDVIELELLQGLHERVAHGLAAGQVRELRGDEELGAGHARHSDTVADGGLVIVDLRGVDVFEASLDSLRDTVAGVLAVESCSGTISEPGDGGAVVERDGESSHFARGECGCCVGSVLSC